MAGTVTVTPDLVSEAKRLTGLRTKREVIELALSELVRRPRLESLRARLGTRDLTVTPEDVVRWRDQDLEE